MGPYHSLTPFVTPLADNSFSFQVYQKPTHTDQYLQWESHHSLSSKYSVIGTLSHRAKLVCTTPELLKEELNHLRGAMGKCNYPHWAIKRVQNKVLNNNQEDTGNNNRTNNNSTSKDSNDTTNNNNQPIITTNNRPTNKAIGQIVIPYTKGTAESIKHICGKYGIQVHFKGNTTIKKILMKPKDRDPKDSKSSLIYSYQCPQLDCNEEYIGETGRTTGERRKEHLKQASPSIHIMVNNPTLNQNIGKYNLNHIWDRVLFNTPGLKLGSSQHPAVIQ